MVELLAVVVILGILMMISIASVSKLLEKARNEFYEKQKENLTLAAQSYGQKNRNKLPKNVGQKVKIPLKDLLNSKYISETIKDYNDNECDMEKSYVQIFKYSKSDYTYLTYLDCPSYTSKEEFKDLKPKITITYNNSFNNAGVDISITDSNKIIGYDYIVSYRENTSSAWREVINSGSVEGKQRTSISVHLDLKKYTPGYLRVVVNATNMYGITEKATGTHNYADTKAPKCVYTSETEYKANATSHIPWITAKNGVRKVTVGCDDGDGIGCARETFTKNFTADAKSGQIVIRDKQGNETTCTVQVYIDKTKPTLTIKAYPRDSKGNKQNTAAVASVTVSDSKPSASMSSYTNNVNGWLNKEKYPYGIYYEITYSDTTGNISKTWQYNKKNLVQSAANNLTEKSTTNFAKTSGSTDTYFADEGYRMGKYSISDEAGNTVSIDITAPLDRTAPTKPEITNPTNGNWTNKDFSLTVKTNETMSGYNYWQYKYDSTSTWTTYNNSAKSPFTTTPFSAERNENVYLRHCDKAGNCSSNSSTKIKIDKGPPSCSINLSGTYDNSTGWYKAKNVSISLARSDKGSSGVATYGLTTSTSITYNSTASATQGDTGGVTWYGYVKDSAGNENKCSKTFKVDKTPPTCVSSGGQSGWTNKSVTLYGTCSDNLSGCKQNITKEFKTNTNSTTASPGTVYDNAGNSASCPGNQTVKVDTTAPTCGYAKNATTAWTANNRTISQACSDTGGSGCAKASYDTTYSTTTKTGSVDIFDNAGNKKTCSYNVYVDKTPPTCYNGDIVGNWTSADRTLGAYCKDDHSGCPRSRFTKTYTETTLIDWLLVNDNVGNTDDCLMAPLVDKDPPKINFDTTPTYSCTFTGGRCGIASSWCSGADCTVNMCITNAYGYWNISQYEEVIDISGVSKNDMYFLYSSDDKAILQSRAWDNAGNMANTHKVTIYIYRYGINTSICGR